MLLPTVPPLVEPVTLSEARLQCRVDPGNFSEDTRLANYISAARGMAEHETGLRFITQTWTEQMSSWPADGRVVLREGPVQSVVTIIYNYSNGAAVTVNTSAYRTLRSVPTQMTWIAPAIGTSWPTGVQVDNPGAITVTYVVGFGNTHLSVPQEIREWILTQVSAMWENRSAIGPANSQQLLPYLGRLLDPWRTYK